MPTPDAPSSTVDLNRLKAESWLASVEHHRVLRSTNDRAKALARAGGAELPAMILADRQTAGRGRGSNQWWTGDGSLAFTLLVDTDPWGLPGERVPLTALVAGMALVEAVGPSVPSHSVGLHWPNDVYVDTRKLAGILVEMPMPNRLVVGVGVNTNCRIDAAPDELRTRVATLLDLTGERQEHTALLLQWLHGWQRWTGLLASGEAEIGRRANDLCLQHGQIVRVRRGAEILEGRCLGIAPNGALRLETGEGVCELHSGTIE